MFIVHFLPYLLVSLLNYNFSQPGAMEWFAIYLVGIQYLFYILISLKPYFKLLGDYRKGGSGHFVIVYLFPVFALLWFYYPVSELTGTNYQLWETVLHSVFIYYMMFLLLKAPKAPKDKYRFSDINEEASQRIFIDIQQRIAENKYYLDPDLTSGTLARKLKIPLNTLSQVINQMLHHHYVVDEVTPCKLISMSSKPSVIHMRTAKGLKKGTCNAFVYVDFIEVSESTSRV